MNDTHPKLLINKQRAHITLAGTIDYQSTFHGDRASSALLEQIVGAMDLQHATFHVTSVTRGSPNSDQFRMHHDSIQGKAILRVHRFEGYLTTPSQMDAPHIVRLFTKAFGEEHPHAQNGAGTLTAGKLKLGLSTKSDADLRILLKHWQEAQGEEGELSRSKAYALFFRHYDANERAVGPFLNGLLTRGYVEIVHGRVGAASTNDTFKLTEQGVGILKGEIGKDDVARVGRVALRNINPRGVTSTMIVELPSAATETDRVAGVLDQVREYPNLLTQLTASEHGIVEIQAMMDQEIATRDALRKKIAQIKPVWDRIAVLAEPVDPKG